jgi:hypothetical protein
VIIFNQTFTFAGLEPAIPFAASTRVARVKPGQGETLDGDDRSVLRVATG